MPFTKKSPSYRFKSEENNASWRDHQHRLPKFKWFGRSASVVRITIFCSYQNSWRNSFWPECPEESILRFDFSFCSDLLQDAAPKYFLHLFNIPEANDSSAICPEKSRKALIDLHWKIRIN